ncbi:EamA-like transporter family protein [Anoxybacillus vitaminiphilus]|uniref:EamA-like transporter family protein n=1 Tax=Paranoxybacillus vitaminiphilus TaxID=581036 RepID=A0A327YTW1_9BACL|nr:DMT family transporter [Anoxybacillus vitaminiphilus]RAK23507.1 EamA-like transporter family protein [Anoxybacillus vitaminiphilus]
MKKQWAADMCLLFVTFIWGATFVLVQNAISFLEPLSFNGVRFLLAGLFLLIWLFIFHRPQLKMWNGSLLLSGAFMGFWLFSGYAFQTIGLLYTTSAKAGFITGLSVVLVPLFAFFLLKQKPKANAILGVLIAATGLYLLTMNGELSVNKGDVLVFLCAVSFGMHIVITGKYSSQFPTLLLTITQIFTVAILCVTSAFFFEDWTQMLNGAVLQKTEVWSALLITSLLATAFAFLVQTNFQKYTTATRVALIFAMEPVFAAFTAYIWAGERLTISAFAGCLLILLGMILAELPISFSLRKNFLSTGK